jgi:hypothetical protein
LGIAALTPTYARWGTLGIAPLTPTYALWECGHLARLVDFSLAATPPLTDLIPVS